MSTKNLARTVIEGGRTHYSQWERKTTIRSRRAFERASLARVTRDPDGAESRAPREPARVGPSFSDKLGPARRWLASHTGEPWDAVYAEMRRRFDLRTIPGRHIVVDHMLHWVQRDVDFARWGRREFVVDEDGILRAVERRRRRGQWFWREQARLERWLGMYRIGRRGSFWFFFQPIVRNLDPIRYRQAHRLSDEQTAAWEAFPGEARKGFTLPV